MLQKIQFWKLKVNADQTAQLICERDANDAFLTQDISFTDFQLDEIKLYLIDGVPMLPSEYWFQLKAVVCPWLRLPVHVIASATNSSTISKSSKVINIDKVLPEWILYLKIVNLKKSAMTRGYSKKNMVQIGPNTLGEG